MSNPKSSRNGPCPCGSGKKYKVCCMRKSAASPPLATRKLLPPDPPRREWTRADLGNPYWAIDPELQRLARTQAGSGDWQARVAALSARTPLSERAAAYHAVRAAGVLDDDCCLFLFDHLAPLAPSSVDLDDFADDDEEDDRRVDQHWDEVLRNWGLGDWADLRQSNREEFDRRRERGRFHFNGPLPTPE